MTTERLHAVTSCAEEPLWGGEEGGYVCVCLTVLVHTRCKEKKKDLIYPLLASESWVRTAELSEASLRIDALLRCPRLFPCAVAAGRGWQRLGPVG